MLSCVIEASLSETYYKHIVDVIFAGRDVVEVIVKEMLGE
jgi:hypothetical protein